MHPKEFQLRGADFLAARTRALLADEPGVGKTAQVVLGCRLLGAVTVRVVCPSVGIEHWWREFKRWGGGYHPQQLEVLSWDEARRLKTVSIGQVDVLVLDECHYAKNPNAQRTAAVFARGGLGWHAKRIWSLSGTPAPNNVAELWPMLRAYGATKMDYEQFVHYFCRVDQDGKVRGSRADRMPELRAILKPFTLRRKKADVLPELGAIDIQPWYVTPSAQFIPTGEFEAQAKQQERELRERIKNLPPEDLLAFLAGSHEFATVRRYNALLKTPAVFEQVMYEIDSGQLDKVVIYGYHPEPLDILEREFNKAGVGAVAIHGSTPTKRRDAYVQEWKHPNGPRVMLASIIAAGVVLDFTEAHQGIILELDWVDANNTQAMQRMHRHGQPNSVTIRVAMGSPIDEIINSVCLRKAKDFAALFDTKTEVQP